MGINQTKDDAYFMRLAMAQAHTAEQQGEVPVGAVIVQSGEVVAAAYNQMINLNNPTAHAENLVLAAAGEKLQNYRLVDCDLFVTLEPCTMCAGAMIHARIKRVVFGAFDSKTGVLGSVDNMMQKPYHNHQIEVVGGVLGDECGQLLSQFFKQRRIANKSKRCE
ncbi:tRNA adenosine(34) deaminase TadA [Marinicella litoralis]|uniref:tRNA-specific adenosine deaminase n=1 Tax=Marinicella litoralis TaxID=644220 RepID=A0A4R6XQ66_9GAMM|nr:tRNA adenosine(34) deaminase TadA [Marinicella litoralis]TDR18378.1 tRNA(adenine34) deaminase [Marinicella litoralis]